MRIVINQAEAISLLLAVQIAKVGARLVVEQPDSDFAREWRAAEVADGGEVVSNLLPDVMREAEAVSQRIAAACGMN